MKTRIVIPLTAAAVLLFVAFSVKSAVFLMAAVLILLIILSGLISVLQASRTMQTFS